MTKMKAVARGKHNELIKMNRPVGCKAGAKRNLAKTLEFVEAFSRAGTAEVPGAAAQSLEEALDRCTAAADTGRAIAWINDHSEEQAHVDEEEEERVIEISDAPVDPPTMSVRGWSDHVASEPATSASDESDFQRDSESDSDPSDPWASPFPPDAEADLEAELFGSPYELDSCDATLPTQPLSTPTLPISGTLTQMIEETQQDGQEVD